MRLTYKLTSTLLLLILMIGNFTSCRKGPGLLMLGLNEKGQLIKQKLPYKDTDQMGEVIDTIDKEVIVMLNDYPIKSQWKLNEIRLGLSISMKAGIVVASASAEPSIEVYFNRVE